MPPKTRKRAETTGAPAFAKTRGQRIARGGFRRVPKHVPKSLEYVQARREAEGVGKTSAARAASEPSRGRKERKRRRFLRNRDAFSCALCSANETSQWRTLASMEGGDRDEDDALVCNKCYARARRARLVAAREG